jgi:hypothetical protein
MKALLSETISGLFPHTGPADTVESTESMGDLYTMPFDPEQLVICFKDWQYYAPCNRYFDKSEDCNLVWFEGSQYFINGRAFRRPVVLLDFINDCLSLGIEIRWNKEMAFSLCRTMAA